MSSELRFESLNPEIEEFLANTVYGKKGGLQYRHLNTATRLREIPAAEFATLRHGNRVIATAGIVSRTFDNGPLGRMSAYYVRYLSIHVHLNRQKDSRNPRGAVKRKIQPHSLKGTIARSLVRYFQNALVMPAAPILSYAYVEADNSYSMDLCIQHGYMPVRKFSTFIFSRLRPHKDSRVWLADEAMKQSAESLEAHFYKDYHLYENATTPSALSFVYIVNGKPVAGLQALPVEWDIQHVPGIGGFFLQNILPIVVPKFDTRRLKFLAFHRLWFAEGFQESLPALMEAACAHFQRHIGLAWCDTESHLALALRSSRKLGLLHQFKKEMSAQVVAKFVRANEPEKQLFSAHPVFISALDIV